MTSYESERALVHLAEQIIRTFGKEFGFGIQELKQEPAEPLIKDKNTRKAVRAWAEVNSIKTAIYAERSDKTFCVLTDMGTSDYAIEFVGWIPTIKDGEVYTIDELCGEEKE